MKSLLAWGTDQSFFLLCFFGTFGINVHQSRQLNLMIDSHMELREVLVCQSALNRSYILDQMNALFRNSHFLYVPFPEKESVVFSFAASLRFPFG